MKIVIDTPYVTVGEMVRRSGQSDSAIRNEIDLGHFLIRQKKKGSKSAVLINMVHLAMEAVEQAERVRDVQETVKAEQPSEGVLMPASQAACVSKRVRDAKAPTTTAKR